MGQIALSGVLSAGPAGGLDSFPGSSFTVPLGLRSNTSFGVASGVLTQQINSPGDFVALSGVGTLAPVTQGSLLYLRCDGAITLEITTDDGSLGTEVVEVPVMGLFVMEFPTTRPLEALRAKGSARLEYLVAGQS